jgi:hypothetical protein
MITWTNGKNGSEDTNLGILTEYNKNAELTEHIFSLRRAAILDVGYFFLAC